MHNDKNFPTFCQSIPEINAHLTNLSKRIHEIERRIGCGERAPFLKPRTLEVLRKPAGNTLIAIQQACNNAAEILEYYHKKGEI